MSENLVVVVFGANHQHEIGPITEIFKQLGVAHVQIDMSKVPQFYQPLCEEFQYKENSTLVYVKCQPVLNSDQVKDLAKSNQLLSVFPS